ncbi:hypothetical protein BYT27DRAFT_7215911 [Phlegmacium glaucopus]|nr:hypothetical protein BYT27DRAFT_7215911 [Phlegmacium glaucopus]
MRIYADSCAEKAKSEQPLLTSSLPSLSSTNVLNKHQHSWIMPTSDAGQLRDHAASTVGTYTKLLFEARHTPGFVITTITVTAHNWCEIESEGLQWQEWKDETGVFLG